MFLMTAMSSFTKVLNKHDVHRGKDWTQKR